MIVEASGITFRYPGSVELALDDLSLNVASGELFGLLGPNGAGKSTLISMLTGLRRPDAGSVRYDNQLIADKKRVLAKELAWVPQEYAFYPTMSARENLLFFSGVLELDSSTTALRVAEVLEIAGLEHVGKKQAGKYSGGMKRRLNLAIGLLGHPNLLFLDEPTVGIDPQSRQFILDAISEINKRGTTVVYSSHYMEEVEKLCDRIAIIDNGKLLISGTVQELMGQEIDAGMSGSKVLIRMKLPLSSDYAVRESFLISADRMSIEGVNIGTMQLAEQLSALANDGLICTRVQAGAESLEQLFLQLTSRSLRD